MTFDTARSAIDLTVFRQPASTTDPRQSPGRGLSVAAVDDRLAALGGRAWTAVFETAALAIAVPELEAKILLGRHLNELVVAAASLDRRLERIQASSRPDRTVCRDFVAAGATGLARSSLAALDAAYAAREAVVAEAAALREDLDLVLDEPSVEAAAGLERTILRQKRELADRGRGCPVPEIVDIESSRRDAPPTAMPARDARFQIIDQMPTFPSGATHAVKMQALMHHLLTSTEIPTIEACAGLMLDFPEMPMAFFEDLGTQVWDEARHAVAFHRRLRELGGTIGEFPIEINLWRLTVDRPMALRLAVHQRLGEWLGVDAALSWSGRLRDMGDEQNARILEFIMADEINHVRLGNAWIRHALPTDEEVWALHREAEGLRFDLFAGRDAHHPVNVDLCIACGFTPAEADILAARTGVAEPRPA